VQSSAIVLQGIFSAALLLCLGIAGCGTTCVSGFWDGNKSGVGVSNTSCPLTPATGTVVGQMSAASSPTSAVFSSPLTSPRDIQHIFVTLRAIEARPDIRADAASSGWQQLAPDLAARPVQLDLMAGNGDSLLAGSPASLNFTATVPADEYRQLRLRLVPSHSSPEETTPESNACGSAGWNCIVFADRSVRPLEFGSDAPEFQIAIGQGASNFFRVLPGDVGHLSIEFDPASSVFFASDAAVRLVPVFRVASRSSTREAN
jgi:uncharacterized protein DUF4382